MKADSNKALREVEHVADELADVLCDWRSHKFGTMQNMKARKLSRELHEKAAKLRQIFDPS